MPLETQTYRGPWPPLGGRGERGRRGRWRLRHQDPSPSAEPGGNQPGRCQTGPKPRLALGMWGVPAPGVASPGRMECGGTGETCGRAGISVACGFHSLRAPIPAALSSKAPKSADCTSHRPSLGAPAAGGLPAPLTAAPRPLASTSLRQAPPPYGI